MANDLRVVAVKTLGAVINQGRSLNQQLLCDEVHIATKERSLYKELCYGVLRWYWRDTRLIQQLTRKPLKRKDRDVLILLHIGCYQLLNMRTPDHATINGAVNACRLLGKPWAKGLVNAVLRNLQRKQETLINNLTLSEKFSHPTWLTDRLLKSWPQQTQKIMAANNSRAPMCLRVNQTKTSREAYLQQLKENDIAASFTPFAPHAIKLQLATAVEQLPEFEQGLVSVQDEAAQLAAPLLQLEPKQRVLDACCAPGGKTAHILETEPNLGVLVAIDSNADRLSKVATNLHRLHLTATLHCGDACKPDSWWDTQSFDRILVDAPCSATGVIRRHPDIKLLRKDTDIHKLQQLQLEMLTALWPLLTNGGLLVYATCSVLPEENEQLISLFLNQHQDAQHQPINAEWGEQRPYGRQLFPQTDGHDGFFYACLRKTAST